MFKKFVFAMVFGGLGWMASATEVKAHDPYGLYGPSYIRHYSGYGVAGYPSYYGQGGCGASRDVYAYRLPPSGYYSTYRPYTVPTFGGFQSGYAGFSSSVPFGSYGGNAFPSSGAYGAGSGFSLWIGR